MTIYRLALIRQDSLLAACFDRRTTSSFGTEVLDPYQSSPLSHKSAMDHMVDFLLRSNVVADESDQPNLALRRDLANALDIIKWRTHRESYDQLESAEIQYQCQIHHLDLQFGFVKAWLCRPALRHLARLDTDTSGLTIERELYAMCLQSARYCLYAFVKLSTLCDYPFRSWSIIHNGLSTFLLLALSGELKRDADLRATFGELLDLFESGYAIPRADHHDIDQGAHLPPAYTRAIKALRQMFLRDNITTTNDQNTLTSSCNRNLDATNPVIPR